MHKNKNLPNLSRRSQAWGIDITVAVVIFTIGLVVVYLYSINLSSEAQDALDSLSYQGNIIASSLLLDGTPSNWQLAPNNVLVPGLTENGKINNDKLANFSSLMESQPQFVKSKFNTKYDFCVNITGWGIKCTCSNPTCDLSVKCYDSHCDPAIFSPSDLIRVERYVAYKNKPSIMEIRIWD